MRGPVFVVLALSLLGLAGCTSDKAPERAAVHPLTGQVVARPYRLGPADKLRIITYNEPSLTGEFVVGGGGGVALPLAGEVAAAGLTTGELARAIEAALRNGYLTDPKVSVEVLTYRPFYILGEVNKPGEYPFVNGLTVLNAVATAQGFSYRANTRRVRIKHADEAAEHDFDLTASTPVEPGDTIRIKERFF
jgi:protein involved in polysaccharide export with SLBB domain